MASGSVFKDMLELFDVGADAAKTARRRPMEPNPDVQYSPKPKPAGGELSAARAPRVDVPNPFIGKQEAPAAAPSADPFAAMWRDMEKSPRSSWRATHGGRIFADTEKGNLNISNMDYRRNDMGAYLTQLESSAQARGLGEMRFTGPAAERVSDVLGQSGYTQEGKAWTKKLAAGGAAAGAGVVAAGGDAEAQSAGYRLELPDGKVATFPPGTTMKQVQEAVDRYNEETKTGWGRTKELFKHGVENIKRGGQQLSGELPQEPIPDLARRIAQIPPDQEQTDPARAAGNKTAYQKLAGAGNIAAGVWDLITAPWGMVSQPLSKVDIPTGTGEKLNIPPKATEAVLGLFTPMGAVKAGKQAVQNVPWQTLNQGTRSAITSTIAKMPSFPGKTPDAQAAQALIRAHGGTAARETATTMQNLEQYRRQVNAMSDVERMDLYRYMEGRSVGQNITNPAHQALADQVKVEFQKRMTTLQNMTSTQRMSFIIDYFPHMWNDPRAAANAMRQAAKGTTGKQGSGANLRKRDIPTISDGLARGLTLKTTDPIEATMAYVSNMDRFIAANKVVEEARNIGKVKYYLPGNRHIPPDWKPLEGRLATKATPAPGVIMRAYAPKEFATIYNNFIDKGFYRWERPGQAYEAALKTSNAVTALELGLSGFHAVVMANEAGISSLATGIRQIVGGAANKDWRTLLGGVKQVAQSPGKFVSSAIRGAQMKNVYLGQTPGTAHMQKMVELLERAGGRGAGHTHAPDYKFSAMNSYWTSWKRGALKLEAKADLAQIKTEKLGVPKVFFRHLGRVLTTVAQPLFEKYIPNLKNGAFYDAMTSWMKMNPGATQTQQLAEARRIWDSIDNRLGETVQDNIFWNKLFKQVALLAMRSYSWNLGTVREIGGGAVDLAKSPFNKDFSSRAAYVLALPIWVATMNAVYQKMKTGKDPESVQDLMAGQTGGEAPGAAVPGLPRGRGMPNVPTRRQATVPERVMIPGYQKDVFGWYEHWQQELKNKIATAPRMAWELTQNQDWKNDPIFSPEESAPVWLKEFMTYVGNSLGPISARQMMKGQKEGSNISTVEMLGGLRPAPAYLTDPEGHAEALRRRRTNATNRREFLKKRQDRQYGGSQE